MQKLCIALFKSEAYKNVFPCIKHAKGPEGLLPAL